MNFTAQLPNGMDKASWIASLPKGSLFCTRRPIICQCGENSLKHTEFDGKLYCKFDATKGKGKELIKQFGSVGKVPLEKGVWQPLPPKLKVGNERCLKCGMAYEQHAKGIAGMPHLIHDTRDFVREWKKYAICSGRGTKAICECGVMEAKHHNGVGLCHSERVSSTTYKRVIDCKGYNPISCELVSVMDEMEWIAQQLNQFSVEEISTSSTGEALPFFKEEAHREGFETWGQLDKWITDYYGGRPKMWRYEFRR